MKMKNWFIWNNQLITSSPLKKATSTLGNRTWDEKLMTGVDGGTGRAGWCTNAIKVVGNGSWGGVLTALAKRPIFTMRLAMMDCYDPMDFYSTLKVWDAVEPW